MKRRSGEKDTISAISTAPGMSGIGIVRVSGNDAFPIVASLYRGKKRFSSFTSRTAHFGEVVDPGTQEVIDEAIFLVMKRPQSYTGEDVVEIQSHGNPFLLEKIVSLLLQQGARLAMPGEFTRRAFLSGRIDLAQAEAVMEIISSRSALKHQWALGQLKGHLSQKIISLKGRLISIIAQIEASIDFSDAEIPLCRPGEMKRQICEVLQDIRSLLADYEKGRQIREGFTVVIVGRPNVGKSSLLNLFLHEDRAIVTPFPGTTRDLLQETIDLNGISLRLIDTAGYHKTEHPVEQEGVRRGESAQKSGDLCLWLLDASESITEDDLELADRLRDAPKIVILNKVDLPRKLQMASIPGKLLDGSFLNLSIKTGEGFDHLQNKLRETLVGRSEREQPLIGLLRHKKSLASAALVLSRASKAIEEGLSLEFPAIDLREAVDALGEITGETTVDEILDQIFERFCIGK